MSDRINDLLSKYLTEDDGPADGVPSSSGANTTSQIAKMPGILGLYRRKKKKRKVINEAMNSDELIMSLGGELYIKKKYKTLKAAMHYVYSNIDTLIRTLGIKKSEIPLITIENKLKSLYKETDK